MRRAIISCAAILLATVTALWSQSVPPASSSSAAKHAKGSTAKADLDVESLADGFYRNKTIGVSCKIPPGWVIRTEEMNAHGESAESKPSSGPAPASSSGGKVLLAAFSRPPEARAEDINASILIAVENQSAYPGLKEAAQYFQPLSEVAKAQGFTMDEDPYAIAIGSKLLVRGDFHKDVGSRVMRQSTLAFLAQGYAVSITVIGGTDDEVEDLVDGITFAK
ncbi:MAG TPA: hypothetical protein VGG04_13370 [Candidatus Sulfotelmatobacter sp.]|jgi:hypothetical protein